MMTPRQHPTLPAAPLRTGPRLAPRATGRCARCEEVVDLDAPYVRLHRQLWHLDCALMSERLVTTFTRPL